MPSKVQHPSLCRTPNRKGTTPIFVPDTEQERYNTHLCAGHRTGKVQHPSLCRTPTLEARASTAPWPPYRSALSGLQSMRSEPARSKERTYQLEATLIASRATLGIYQLPKHVEVSHAGAN